MKPIVGGIGEVYCARARGSGLGSGIAIRLNQVLWRP
jgi:hypothetical protein